MAALQTATTHMSHGTHGDKSWVRCQTVKTHMSHGTHMEESWVRCDSTIHTEMLESKIEQHLVSQDTHRPQSILQDIGLFWRGKKICRRFGAPLQHIITLRLTRQKAPSTSNIQGSFRGNLGLFCGDIGLFCRDIATPRLTGYQAQSIMKRWVSVQRRAHGM